jgi:hypothetical protein
MEGLLEALPRLALGCRRRKGLTTLLAERHARHLAGEHKLCETPANQCTLTLLCRRDRRDAPRHSVAIRAAREWSRHSKRPAHMAGRARALSRID